MIRGYFPRDNLNQKTSSKLVAKYDSHRLSRTVFGFRSVDVYCQEDNNVLDYVGFV